MGGCKLSRNCLNLTNVLILFPQDDPSQPLKKCVSFPELSPVLEQKLFEGRASSDLQEAYNRAATLAKTPTPSTAPRGGSTVDAATKLSDSKSASDTALKTCHSHDSVRSSSDDVSSSQKTRGCSFTSIPEEDLNSFLSSSPVGSRRPSSVVLEKPIKWPPVLGGSGKEAIHGGVSPSFLFLQLYHSHMFGMGDERPIALPTTPVSHVSILQHGDHV